MHRKSRTKSRRNSLEQGLLHKVSLQYRSVRTERNSESDILLSGDDELLDTDEPIHRTSMRTVVA